MLGAASARLHMAIPTTSRGRGVRAVGAGEGVGRPNRFQLSLLTPMLARATRDVVSQLDQPCLLLSSDDVVRYANGSFLDTLAIDERVDGRSFFEIASGAFDTPAVRERLTHVRQGGRVHGWQLERAFPTVGSKILSIDLVAIRGGFFETGLTVLAMRDETERAILESSIARKDHDQADLATRLSRLRAAETPSATAWRIINELARVSGLDFIALGSFGAGDRFVPMAVQVPPTAPFAVGRAIPDDASRYLHERAQTGPWIETWHARSEDGSYGAQMMATGISAAAYAPIHGPTSLVGLLILGTTSPAGAELLNGQFPALLSFAAIAGALLGPVQERHNKRAVARNEIESIIEDQAFEPVFQPVVELGSGRIVGYEALTRFADRCEPAERFAEASRLGIGTDLELACARRAIEAASALPEGAWISINASPAMLLDTPELAGILAASHRDVVLEITERAAVDDYVALHRAIAALGPGVRVAVDDAGAGYAGLQRILELRADLVKLDLVLVRGVDSDPARQALVAGMTHFARRTNARLLAEGVESQAEADALLDLGVELGQGFLFGRPLPAGEAVTTEPFDAT
jgi:EAL domain-containing protein (putative c-di-GMP-specific phosphodiesterase class I)